MMADTAKTTDELAEAHRTKHAAIREMVEMARRAGSWQGIAEGKDIIIRQLEDERDRLRAALQRIADTGPPAEYERIARKALRHG